MADAKLHTIKLPYPDKGDRNVWVYVPSHSDGEKLPVVYMTDGQNLFDDNSTPHGSWEVVKAVENEQKSGVGNAVIVGIDNGNAWRDSELTPKSIGEVQHLEMFCENFKPEGEIFDNFLMNTVIPYVENNFPVCTDRQNVAVCGSSSGGLMSFFSAFEHPENRRMQVCFLLHFSVTQERIGRNIFRQKLLKICRISTSIRVTVTNLKR